MRTLVLLLFLGCVLTGAAAATYTVDGSHTYALGYTHHGRAAITGGLHELLCPVRCVAPGFPSRHFRSGS